MENQEQIINQLKAEVYDVSKQLQQVNNLVSQIAHIVRAETVDDMLAKITKAFAPPVTVANSLTPESEVEQPKLEPTPVKPRPKTKSRPESQ